MQDQSSEMHHEVQRALAAIRDECRALHEETQRVSTTMQAIAADVHLLAERRIRRPRRTTT
jgi:hypothetical protein